MRSNISRRLKLLEQKAHIHGTPQPVIFARFVSPGQPCKSNRAECDGQVWERMAHETPQDFERRIRENLQRHEDGATVVIFFPEKTNRGSAHVRDCRLTRARQSEPTLPAETS